MNAPVKLAPTREAIDGWRQQGKPSTKAGEPVFGVDIRTRAGSWRCIISAAYSTGDNEFAGYWTIRGEGSSNEGKETFIAIDRIAEARGWKVN